MLCCCPMSICLWSIFFLFRRNVYYQCVCMQSVCWRSGECDNISTVGQCLFRQLILSLFIHSSFVCKDLRWHLRYEWWLLFGQTRHLWKSESSLCGPAISNSLSEYLKDTHSILAVDALRCFVLRHSCWFFVNSEVPGIACVCQVGR